MQRMLGNITALRRITTACWSAARPECSLHVSDTRDSLNKNHLLLVFKSNNPITFVVILKYVFLDETNNNWIFIMI